MSRGKVIAGVVVLAVIVAVVGGVLYSSSASVPTVTTAKVALQTLAVTVTASGKIEAARRVDVYPPAAGTLEDVAVSDGATVTAGQTLAKMDTAPLLVQVRQAASALAGARAQLDAVNRGVPSAIDHAAASAGVAAAQAAYDAAASAYNAYKAVAPSTDATLTQLLIAKKQAYAGLENAKSAVGKISGAAKVSLARAAASASVDAASAALKFAKDTLSAATITAPISGVVVFNPTAAPGTDSALPKAQEGSAVAPGSAPFTVIDLSTLSFDAQVDEADVAKVAPKMTAKVSLDAFPASTFTGTVTAVRSTAVQTTTGGIAFPVLMRVDEAGSRLLVGMSGSADIEVDAVQGALTVPIESVLDESGKKFVFVLGSDNTVKKTEVTVGALTDTSAQILTGLTDGQTVVTSNLTTLKDGAAVRAQ